MFCIHQAKSASKRMWACGLVLWIQCFRCCVKDAWFAMLWYCEARCKGTKTVCHMYRYAAR